MKSTRFLSCIQVFMVLTLVSSMLAPAVCSLMDVELTTIVIKDYAEEESQKKGENEKSEKDILLHDFVDVKSYAHYQASIKFGFYSENDTAFSSEIVLQPPEYLV